jgi:hypothetical protein
MMSGEAWLYLLSVLINAVNLFLQVFFTIMYSDLEWYVHITLFDRPCLRSGSVSPYALVGCGQHL